MTTNTFQGDPAIKITPNGATLVFVGGQPILDQGVENQAIIALFTEKGWPGNYLLPPASQIGSDFEKLARGDITLSKLSLIEQTAVAALQADIFGTVTAVASNPESWQVEVRILIEPPGRESTEILLISNGQNWISQAENPAHKSIEQVYEPPPVPPIPVIVDRLYHCDPGANKIYELDPNTLLDISAGGVASPGVNPYGIGGISGRLYHCDNGANKIYELDLDTMLDISGGGVASPGINPYGIGGIGGRLYHCDIQLDKIYELDPNTMLDISAGGVASPDLNPYGIGGIYSRLYHCDDVDKIYELDPNTMLDISAGGVASPGTSPFGIGGIYSRLYHCDNNVNKIYELDPNTLLDISSGGVASPGSSPYGIGGVK